MEKLFVLFFMIRVVDGTLPKGAERVESCPEANNITAWIGASKRFGCSDYTSKITKNTLVYHCIASGFLNETIELCAKIAAIPKDHCPIYNYQKGATVVTSRSCAHFTNGCPSPTEPLYHSNSFYEYSACWDINKKSKCYHADPNCHKKEMSYQTAVPNDQNIDNSVNTTTNQATTPNVQNPPATVSNTPVWAIVLPVILSLIVVVIITVFIWKRKFCTRLLKTQETDDQNDPEKTPLKETEENKEQHGNLQSLIKIEEEKNTIELSKKSHEHNTESKKEDQESKYAVYEKEYEKGNNGTENETDYPEKDTKKGDEEEKISDTTHTFIKKTPDIPTIPDTIDTTIKENETDYSEKDTKKGDEEEKISDTTNTFIKKTPDIPTIPDTIDTTIKAPDIPTIPDTRDTTVMDKEVEEEKQDCEINDNVNRTTEENLETNDDLLEFNSFILRIGEELIKQNKMKRLEFLLNDHEKKNLPTDKMDLFLHWSEKYQFWYNIWYLQRLLRQCHAIDLFDKCQKFASERLHTAKIYYFTRSLNESGKELLSVHTSLEIEKPGVRQEMEKIRNELVKHLGIDKSDVQLHGITHGSLTFIFSLPEFDATRLLDVPFLNSMWTHKVLKIETQNFILTPDANQRKSKPEKRIRNLSIHKNNGTSISGKQRQIMIHLSNVQRPYSKRNMQKCIEMLMKRLELHKDINVNGDLAMVEINNNKKDSLHSTDKIQSMVAQDEIEPSIVLAHLKEKFPELYDDCEKVVLAGKSRREQAEKLLEYFKKLNGKSFSDIKNSIFTQKGISGKQQNAHNNERLKRKDLMKKIIKENWDFLLEEVDSITISDTFESQNIDDKWQNVWQNYVGMARKVKNELFLNYIYKNEEWLLPFDDVLRKQNLSLPCIMPCSSVTC